LDYLIDNYNNIKHSLFNIIDHIYKNELDDEAERPRWVELNCGCDKPFLETKNQYGHGISDVECKNCGVRFWYHGRWVKKTDGGWEIVWN